MQLQQLQQTDPDKYKLVTQQIAANLQNASQTAQANGNTTAATQLSQLAADFTSASTSGQLPNIQALAKALAAGHRHHHHAAASDTTSTDASCSSSSQTLSQIISAFQTGTSQNDALDPMSIIMNTLSSAGIKSS